MAKKVLLNAKDIDITLHRLACQLVENYDDFKGSALIGIQPRGVFVADRIRRILEDEYHITDLKTGKLDITFFRDDFRQNKNQLQANTTQIDFLVEGKCVVFIDDVLYTGRSINAALTAIQSFGRPKEIELLTLIDRRFSRHLPIQPDYNGRKVDSINTERVKVNWKENAGEDSVYLVNS